MKKILLYLLTCTISGHIYFAQASQLAAPDLPTDIILNQLVRYAIDREISLAPGNYIPNYATLQKITVPLKRIFITMIGINKNFSDAINTPQATVSIIKRLYAKLHVPHLLICTYLEAPGTVKIRRYNFTHIKDGARMMRSKTFDVDALLTNPRCIKDFHISSNEQCDQSYIGASLAAGDIHTTQKFLAASFPLPTFDQVLRAVAQDYPIHEAHLALVLNKIPFATQKNWSRIRMKSLLYSNVLQKASFFARYYAAPVIAQIIAHGKRLPDRYEQQFYEELETKLNTHTILSPAVIQNHLIQHILNKEIVLLWRAFSHRSLHTGDLHVLLKPLRTTLYHTLCINKTFADTLNKAEFTRSVVDTLHHSLALPYKTLCTHLATHGSMVLARYNDVTSNKEKIVAQTFDFASFITSPQLIPAYHDIPPTVEPSCHLSLALAHSTPATIEKLIAQKCYVPPFKEIIKLAQQLPISQKNFAAFFTAHGTLRYNDWCNLCSAARATGNKQSINHLLKVCIRNTDRSLLATIIEEESRLGTKHTQQFYKTIQKQLDNQRIL